jgi:hypothetical protein
MDTNRRSVLKASGIAALIGSTGLAGCSGGLLGGGGGGGVESWQYDPAELAQTGNKFFGSMDIGGLYEARQSLPEGTRSAVDQAENADSPIKPSELDTASGVAGAQVPTGGSNTGISVTGQPQMAAGASTFGSMVITGSFSKSTVTDAAAEDGETQEIGSYQGYTLYETADPSSVGGSAGGAVPSDQSATVGVGEGAVVVGAAQSGESGVTGRQTVEAMIDANGGNAPRLAGDTVGTLRSKLGTATLRFGAVVDPALVETATATMSGQQAQFVQGMRGAGGSMTLEGETTTFQGVVTYESGSRAQDTGITGLVNAFGSSLTQEQGINSVDAATEGASVVITVEGDTQTLIEQGTSGAAGGVGAGGSF